MKLNELDPNNPVDRELAKTSQDVAKDGSLDPDDIAAQAEPMNGGPENMPDDAMAGAGSRADPPPINKPVDRVLMSRMQNHDYIQNYDHSDTNKKSHPARIMALPMDELSHMRQKIQIFNDQMKIKNDTSERATDEINAAGDMLNFVDMVMAYKKMAAKDTAEKDGRRPKVQTRPTSKTPAGKKFTPRRN